MDAHSSDRSRRPRPDVFECDACGNLTFGQRPADCCGASMTAVRTAGGATEGPDVETLLKQVFDMTETELAVCLCVMESEDSTVSEVAEELDVDRSLVSRHLNHLADLGVVEKSRRLRSEGGHVNVYTPVDPETVRRRLRTELSGWLADAVAAVDDVSREKVEAIAEVTDRSAEPRIYE